MATTPLRAAGTVVWPSSLHPHATTVPPYLRVRVMVYSFMQARRRALPVQSRRFAAIALASAIARSYAAWVCASAT